MLESMYDYQEDSFNSMSPYSQSKNSSSSSSSLSAANSFGSHFSHASTNNSSSPFSPAMTKKVVASAKHIDFSACSAQDDAQIQRSAHSQEDLKSLIEAEEELSAIWQ